jgi:C-terminal processing protease CtpA/Prc
LEQYNQRLLKAKTPQEFARIAGPMLAAAKDKHIWLMVDGKHIPAYVNPVTPNANFKLLPQLVPGFQKQGKIVCTGRFPDGIGYILINSWSGTDQDFEPLYAALKDMVAAPGLIIDVRGNGGGSETLAQKFAGCFIDKQALYSKNQNLERDEPNGFGPVYSRYVKPNEEGSKYRGKVAVLSGPVVISSCESFVLMMKQVSSCKVIGQTTQGSSGNPKPHDLGNGVEVYLPSWKDFLPDGTCIEGRGVDPDILIKVTPDKIAKNDPVIDAALKELRKS